MDNGRRNDGGRDDEAGRVARFLRDNPGWLAEQGELYGSLEPPRRVHGERLADHMAAMIEAARERAELMERRAEGALRERRTARTLAGAIRDAVIELIGADDLAEWINGDLPRVLGVDGATLCAEGVPGTAAWRALERRLPVRAVPRGTVGLLLGRAAVRLRDADGTAVGSLAAAEAVVLHGEAAALARFEALVRVPVDGAEGDVGTGGGGSGAMLLALASRDDPGWDCATGNDGAAGPDGSGLGFLGAAVGARVAAVLRAGRGRIGT